MIHTGSFGRLSTSHMSRSEYFLIRLSPSIWDTCMQAASGDVSDALAPALQISVAH